MNLAEELNIHSHSKTACRGFESFYPCQKRVSGEGYALFSYLTARKAGGSDIFHFHRS